MKTHTHTKRILAALACATFLAGGLTACGTRGPGGWSEERASDMRVRMVERVSHRLNLTAEQKLKLDGVTDALKAQRTALRGDGAGPRAELKAIIAGPRFDRARAQALLDQKTAAVQGHAPKVLAALADFYDSLNPEQQQKVRERLDRHRAGWGWGWRGGF